MSEEILEISAAVILFLSALIWNFRKLKMRSKEGKNNEQQVKKQAEKERGSGGNN